MISCAKKEDVKYLALLHSEALKKGFLPRLGESFLQELYRFLIDKEIVLIFKEKNQVVAFISCTYLSQGIMKRFILSRPQGIIYLLWALLKKPSLLKSLWETFKAPTLSKTVKGEESMPNAELLSICVSPAVQQGGVGTRLLEALEAKLRVAKIKIYKVIAGEKLTGANRFYQKNGFSVVRQITIHGGELSNLYVKEL